LRLVGEKLERALSSLPEPERLVPVERIGELLSVSTDWVYDRAAAGELPCYRVGRQLRFAPSEVWAVVQTWRQSPGGK
jgi:excisionase family DNA binding protein